VRAIRNGDPPGRFIRKDDKTGKWVDIGDKKAAEKTSQALREKTNEERDLLKATPGLGVLLPNPASFLAAATASMATGISTLPSAKKADVAKTGESKADDDKEKTDDTADEEAGDKEGEEKTGDKDDDKEQEGAKEESKDEKESEAEPISADGETALV
jgi:hypothetical protein